MADARHNPGQPCWYELGTSDLAGAADFYGNVLGWTVTKAPMEGFDYWLANDGDGNGVVGMMSNAAQEGAPPNWIFYLEVDSADDSAKAITEAGGAIVMPPADIPGTGRYAIATDPQGAYFGILEPLPMEGSEPSVRAFDQARVGHGNWHELSTTDPEAALGFYERVFGWTRGEVMPMGESGDYLIFGAGGGDFGGVMGLLGKPHPAWLCYFGADGVDGGVERVKASGGQVQFGPNEVPGGAWTVVATDPQGAFFGFVGPR